MKFFKTKKWNEDDEIEEIEEDKIPTILPSPMNNSKFEEQFSFPTTLKYLEKDPYLIKCPSPPGDPTLVFWERSKYYNGSFTTYVPTVDLRLRMEKVDNIEEVLYKEVDEEKEGVLPIFDDIHKLFHEAENGPLRIVFLFSTTNDIIYKFSKVSKLFLRVSHFYLQNLYSPTIYDLKKYFSFSNPIEEQFCISILLNTETDISLLLKFSGDREVSFLTFSVYHGYEILFYYLFNGNLDGLDIENPLGRKNPKMRRIEPSIIDYDISALRSRSKILGMMLVKDDERRINITPSVLRCLVYSRDLDTLEYLRKNYRVNLPAYELYSSDYFFSFFLMEYRVENIRVLEYLRHQMRFARVIEVEKDRFLNYCQFMDKKMIEYLAFDENDVRILKSGKKKALTRYTSNNGDYFIQCIEANKKLSKEEKKELVDFLFFNALKCPFPSSFPKGFEFAYFYGRNGYLDELRKALSKIDVPLDYPREFDDSRFGEDLEVLKIVRESNIRPVCLFHLVQFARRSDPKEEPREIRLFFEKYSYRVEDERTISTVIRMCINYCNNLLFRRLMRLEGYELPQCVVDYSVRKMKSSEFVHYLFSKFSEGIRNPRRMERKGVEDLNPFFLHITKNCYVTKYDFSEDYIDLIRSGHFVPSYYSIVRAQNAYGKRKAEEMVSVYQPMILNQLFEFISLCANNGKRGWAREVMKKKFWRDSYLLYFHYERYKTKEKVKFLEMFPRYKKKFSVQCFNCGSELFVFANGLKYGEDFARCQGKGCSVSPRILKSKTRFWREVREIEKLFCKECTRNIRNGVYCVVCSGDSL